MTLLSKREPSFQSAILWSLGAHAALLVIVVLKSLVFPSQDTPYIPALRVDLVGLPDILKKDLDQIQLTPPAKDKAKETVTEPRKATKSDAASAPKAKTTDAPNHRKQMDDALARVKALARIAREQEAAETEQSEKSRPLIKGNQVSEGSSVTGDAKETTQAGYYDAVLSRLQANWTLPVWLARRQLSAKVVVFIDSAGRISGLAFRKSSGDARFDAEVRRAIEASAPFSPPPKEILDDVQSDGILFGFPL